MEAVISNSSEITINRLDNPEDNLSPTAKQTLPSVLDQNDSQLNSIESPLPSHTIRNSQADNILLDQGEPWCAVNDPSLPPVSELEHTIFQCFCHLCNCGKHICPGDYKSLNKCSSSKFLSEYQRNYAKHKLQPIPRYEEPSYIKNNLPIDFTTTNRKDFKAYSVDPLPKNRRDNTKETDNLKFVGRSNYQAEYPNWGKVEFMRASASVLPYRGQEVKMATMSTYDADFRGEANSIENMLKLSPNIYKKQGIFPSVNPSIIKSTSQRDYKPLPRKYLYKNDGKFKHNFEPKISWNGQFNTTYRQSYIEKHMPKPKRKIDTIREIS